MIYLLRTVLIILITILTFKGIRIFNKKFERKILNDIYEHFKSKGLNIQTIIPVTTNSKEFPFNVNEWSLTTSDVGKNYYANRFWKVELIDDKNIRTINWVNTGHLFFYQMYLIVEPSELANIRTEN